MSRKRKKAWRSCFRNHLPGVGALAMVCSATLGLALPASAATITETLKLVEVPADAGALYGAAVAVDGNTMLVASRRGVGGTTTSGTAYLYNTTTGAQTFQLSATDGANSDEFGTDAGISGDRAIVSAFADDDAGSRSGSAYIFDTTNGMQVHKLTASDAGGNDRFGISAAISGNYAIVGANLWDGITVGPTTFGNVGAAYLFDISGAVPVELAILSEGIDGGDEFGFSVGISAGATNRIIVGASKENGGGAAYIYDFTSDGTAVGTTVSSAIKVEGTGRFGISVAIDGDAAVVGAFEANANDGAAYLYDATDGDLLESFDGATGTGEVFGRSVAIDGDSFLVGASTGQAAYLYDFSTDGTAVGTTVTALDTLVASDSPSGANFGLDVAVNGTNFLVGARTSDDGGTDAGSAYFYAVPEPSSFFLLIGCALGFLGLRRKQ